MLKAVLVLQMLLVQNLGRPEESTTILIVVVAAAAVAAPPNTGVLQL
jgi:hypothetical protein